MPVTGMFGERGAMFTMIAMLCTTPFASGTPNVKPVLLMRRYSVKTLVPASIVLVEASARGKDKLRKEEGY